MTQFIKVEVQGPLARVTLDRPEVRNAFNDQLIVELAGAFRALAADEAVRVIVLAAHGPAFCAGADLNWMRRMADYTREQNLADAAALATMLHTIATCPKPTIARVQGDCYAGGMGLVAVCDMAVAVDSANFCLSEVKLGLVPATISPYVVRALGARASQRYMLSAERFDAATAQRLGFVQEVVPADRLDAAVQALVDALLAASPQALAQCKRLLDEVIDRAIDAALIARTVEHIADARASDDGKHGVQSFLAKARPRWSH
jgi:methylglutaconyl-CoA hydratase